MALLLLSLRLIERGPCIYDGMAGWGSVVKGADPCKPGRVHSVPPLSLTLHKFDRCK